MNLKSYNEINTLCAQYHAQLMVVTKNHPMSSILPLIQQRHTLFGENKVQEAESKWSDILKTHPNITLHLIGPLQTNKAYQAITLFHTIQTLDRPKLALKLAGLMGLPENVTRSLFIQVNTGNEPQKAGIKTDEAKNFIDYCLYDLSLPIKGLMCIPPVDEDPTPHFTFLANLRAQFQLPELSAGMSDDYEIALKQGSTIARVGTLIMGERISGECS